MVHKRSKEAMKAIKAKTNERRRIAKEKVALKMNTLKDFLKSEEFLSLGDLPGLSTLDKVEVKDLFDYSRVKVMNSVQQVIDQDLSTVYQVEKILDFGLLVSQVGGKGRVARVPCYKVQWTGYIETTWEPMINMEDCVAVTRFWESLEGGGNAKFRALFESELI